MELPMTELNFGKIKPIKCKNCGKEKGNHKATTLNCPFGMNTRIGYTSFYLDKKFEPKEK